jgi:hypothetical protein
MAEYTTMVVKSISNEPARLDLGYLALFLGLHVNRLVMKRVHAAGFQKIREATGM